ncbi:thioredoxin domain-containing protein [uncultured Desulfuromonas sp.]|uniref:thioredoxin domain-containing protein n=1 Tax=uncultured Desulfuromonas sp. TaxID=181013 RepID=UPI0026104A94|nr:thioredoxin domain-containing protein [uncultured Desulfuromonas sp.]
MGDGKQGEDHVLRLSRVDTKILPPDGGPRYNRLIFCKSPYLLQHAENPVDWHPWTEEAFARALSEDKPVFLSIGYSTCHWCHVMERESFEEKDVAAVINRDFIPIKVDREERPDLDNTYMTVCQMMTGSGGWPLTLLLAPDKKPFFAATYLPPRSRQGAIGLVELLERVIQLWRSDRVRLLRTGEEACRALIRLDNQAGGEKAPDEAPLGKALRQYSEGFDERFAGFGPPPKFPTLHNVSLLLRLWRRSGEKRALEMALQTLHAIRRGGIFDQLGGGLHRYAVDRHWLIPHFEKMLYDQALAVPAFLEAFQASGDVALARAAREVLDYLLRELAHPEGGFYCGEDADSEGAEGTFYLWTPAEVEEVLGKEAGGLFCRGYGICEAGHLEGKSIPHRAGEIKDLAEKEGIEPGALEAALAEGRRALFEARQNRVRPHRDDKILTGWNGLAIAALARGGAVLGDPEAVEAAARTADFLLARMRSESGRLLRRYRLGEAAIPAFLEDYAFLLHGLLELYQAGFVPRRLEQALSLAGEMDELFSDDRGGYFDTGRDAETALVRGRSSQDGALPSGASLACLSLLRLGRLCGDSGLEKKGERLLGSLLPQVVRHPAAYSQTLIALDYALGPKSEVVVVAAPGGEPPDHLLQVLRGRFLPHTEVLLYRPGDRCLEALSPLVRGKEPSDGRAAAFLCREQSCQKPVTDARGLESLLDEISA